MPRIVLDTSVIVAGLRSRNGASYFLLSQAVGKTVVPLLTTALLLEYEAVLKRSDQRVEHGLGIDEIDRFLAGFISLSEPVDVVISWRPQLADANDEMVLEAALNGHADLLVSHNVKDFVGMSDMFKLRIVTPRTLVEELRS